jgi:hypothetical protein
MGSSPIGVGKSLYASIAALALLHLRFQPQGNRRRPFAVKGLPTTAMSYLTRTLGNIRKIGLKVCAVSVCSFNAEELANQICRNTGIN